MPVFICNAFVKSCSIQHIRLTASDSLEERKALVGKVWVGGFNVASTIPKSPIYHGNRDAYFVLWEFDFMEELD